MNTLYIDTARSDEVHVSLAIDGRKKSRSEKVGRHKAQEVLPLLDDLLDGENLTLKDIHQIVINTGPGSFTGLRVGISIASALGLLLNIPINGMPVGKTPEPVYSNILIERTKKP